MAVFVQRSRSICANLVEDHFCEITLNLEYEVVREMMFTSFLIKSSGDSHV